MCFSYNDELLHVVGYYHLQVLIDQLNKNYDKFNEFIKYIKFRLSIEINNFRFNYENHDHDYYISCFCGSLYVYKYANSIYNNKIFDKNDLDIFLKLYFPNICMYTKCNK